MAPEVSGRRQLRFWGDLWIIGPRIKKNDCSQSEIHGPRKKYEWHWRKMALKQNKKLPLSKRNSARDLVDATFLLAIFLDVSPGISSQDSQMSASTPGLLHTPDIHAEFLECSAKEDF